jgi:hypothetical protein
MIPSKDTELEAMASVVASLEPLDADARARVITYAVDRFAVSVAPKGQGRRVEALRSNSPGGSEFADFPDFFHRIGAVTEPEQLLVSAYWLDSLGITEFRAGEISAPLADLGHAGTRVSHSLEALRTMRPSALNQVSKTGRNKVWRVSDAGRKLVESWVTGDTAPNKGRPKTGTSRRVSRTESGTAEPKRKSASLPKIVGELNLRSANVESFPDFVSRKLPSSNSQKELVSIFYLREILKLETVGIDHVFTCFKDRQWRLPANPSNSLQFTASKYRWINTAEMTNIGLTTIGLNFVDHDMPKQGGKEK